MSILEQSHIAMESLITQAHCVSGSLVVVGCSSSEILGSRIGTQSSYDIAQQVLSGILPVLQDKNLFLVAQCCEHLNRALVLERIAAEKFGYPIVNVCPQPNAGGSFATAVWNTLQDPVIVEAVQAQAGLDIGDTLIGMHLQSVAVPVRLAIQSIGAAHLTAARVRPKFIGGIRASYQEDLY